jgi:hypothetical protein
MFRYCARKRYPAKVPCSSFAGNGVFVGIIFVGRQGPSAGRYDTLSAYARLKPLITRRSADHRFSNERRYRRPDNPGCLCRPRAVKSGQSPLVLEAPANRPDNILIAGAAVLVSVVCRPRRQPNSHDGSAAEQLFLQAVPRCKGRFRGSRGSGLNCGRSDWKQALERIRIRSNDF